MIQFQKQNIRDWESRGIKNLIIEFMSRGCEGTEVTIFEDQNIPNGYIVQSIIGTHLTCAFDAKYTPTLQDAVLTLVRGKWILKSDQILTRCGCGKSFSFKTGNAAQDKIRLLKTLLQKKPKHTL